jgi:hypothetical protein
MSSVEPAKSNEAGGLQGTAQNLGASLGTALIGAVLLTGLTSGFVARIDDNTALPKDVRTQIEATASENGLDVVPVEEVRTAAVDAGLPADEADAVAASYGDALLHALKRSLLAVALLAFLGLWLTRHLPGRARAARRERAAPEISGPQRVPTSAG